MPVNQEDVSIANKILWPNETINMTVRQRRIGPGGAVITPTSVIVTNMRIIIINRATLGIRKDYEVIPYKNVTSVRLEKGLISSSVFIRVQGYDRDKGLLKNGREEGEIDGLNNKYAQLFSDFVNEKIAGEQEETSSNDLDNSVGAYVYCSKCGAKDDSSAKFCKNCGAKLE